MYIVTCRSGYSVPGVTADEYELSEFDREDGIRFVDAFARPMGVDVGGEALITELERRKLTYITTHPLMLTLACVIKTRTNPNLPHNAVELLRQVTETLGYRWDEGKGVPRASQMGLSSYNLLESVMLIAHEMSGLKVPMADVVAIVRRYLVLIRRPDVDPERVVGEIRRFYGLLSTTPDGRVQFVHKTIHDYYAARYAVENQLYYPTRVLNWDTRAVYCACMTHDATRSLSTALLYSRSTEAFRECLVNSARFNAEVVAASVFEHFNKFHD
jgi:hypothetical protein